MAEDFLPVLQLLQKEREKTPDLVDYGILCLGTYLKRVNYHRDHNNVSEIMNNNRIRQSLCLCLLTNISILSNKMAKRKIM